MGTGPSATVLFEELLLFSWVVLLSPHVCMSLSQNPLWVCEAFGSICVCMFEHIDSSRSWQLDSVGKALLKIHLSKISLSLWVHCTLAKAELWCRLSVCFHGFNFNISFPFWRGKHPESHQILVQEQFTSGSRAQRCVFNWKVDSSSLTLSGRCPLLFGVILSVMLTAAWSWRGIVLYLMNITSLWKGKP